MNKFPLALGRVLGELLVLQRWAGGDSVSAARIYGLMNGFETAVDSELEQLHSDGISEKTQDRIEDLLQEIDQGTTHPSAVKNWLRDAEIDEQVACCVMRLCQLESRFPDVVDRICRESGEPFCHIGRRQVLPNADWFGSLHYMELVDCSGESEKKLHAAFSPCVPRVGELVEPEGGQLMRVVDVQHVVSTNQDRPLTAPILVPHVCLEPVDEGTSDDDDD